MKSNLNKKEFKERLAELTAKGKSFYFFTSYNPSGPPFYGTYDENTFKLTRNTFWQHAKSLEITGEYIDLGNNLTEVIYKIRVLKFTRYFSIAVGSLSFLILNIIFILLRSEVSVAFALNGFFVFACLWAFIVDWVTKKIIDQRFREEFEIGVEDEWERHAASINK